MGCGDVRGTVVTGVAGTRLSLVCRVLRATQHTSGVVAIRGAQEGGRSNTGQLSSSDAAELATAAVHAIWDVQGHLHHTLKLLRTQPRHSPRLHTTSTLTQDSGGGVNTQAYCRDEGSRDQPTVPPKLGMIKVLQRGKVAHWQDTMCCRNALGCAVGKRTKECQLEPQPALATSVMSVRSTFERKCPCLQL